MKSLRSTKSSRTSSPFVGLPNAPSPSPASEPRHERTQTLLDSWVEPKPKTPVPSFEDHGFERGGVVASMAPLGALPPPQTKLKFKQPKAETPSESRDQSPVLLPAAEVTSSSQTPAGTPPPQEVVPKQEEMKALRIDVDLTEPSPKIVPQQEGSASV
jgi:hypothetical protein